MSSALLRTFTAVIVLWLVLDGTARALGSVRGEYGVVVCAAVLLVAFVVETVLARTRPRETLVALGLRAPNVRSAIWTVVLCVGLLAFLALYANATGVTIAARSDAWLLALGMFAQGGIAEELVFRGFLFRRLRETRSFWRAAAVAAIPFIAVHLTLFVTLPADVATMALLVSLSLTFPFARLFERSGGSVVPVAILHFVVQGSLKVLDGDEAVAKLAIPWMVVAALAPWLVFLQCRDPKPRR
ncbi:MAG: CPBP family intramembrane glutamic endopeptidase [Kofleriaceae bacterium]